MIKGRNQQLVRCLSVKAKLESGRWWGLQELAEMFSVHPRTIRRDIEALEAAGVLIQHEERQEKWGVLRQVGKVA